MRTYDTLDEARTASRSSRRICATDSLITRRWRSRRCARWGAATPRCPGWRRTGAIGCCCCPALRRAIRSSTGRRPSETGAAKTGATSWHRASPWTAGANSAPLWIERLLPGIAAAALHGVIRTGHAVRSLGDAVTPQRLAELRDATAYWAAHYQTLPTEQDGAPPLPAREAVLRLSRIPTERQKRCGAITSALDVLADEPAFAAAIDLLDVSGDPTVVLSDLTETFSRVFLANAVDQMGLITFIHGVTGVVALRSLLPLLPAGAVREALRRLWQIDAALYVALGVAPPLSGEIVAPKEGRETLIDRAVATNDEHAIKFTEAALREYDIRPNPVYLAAIARAIAALS